MCEILEMKTVVFKNINYSVGFFLLSDVTEDEFLCFICIKHLYSVGEVLYIMCHFCTTIRYDKKFNSYVVKYAQNFITLQLSSLKYEHPVSATVFERETHIVPHHYCCIEFGYCDV